MTKIFKVKIYVDGYLATTATGENLEYLESWAEDVCAFDDGAYYTAELCDND